MQKINIFSGYAIEILRTAKVQITLKQEKALI